MGLIEWWLRRKRIRQAELNSLKKVVTPRICKYRGCSNKLSVITRFKCPYCKKVFCEAHRLPEDHKCKNPSTPAEMKETFESWTFGRGKK